MGTTTSELSPCIAGIGFVIENEMKCFVFIFRPYFIADYSLVLLPAMIPADLKPDLG